MSLHRPPLCSPRPYTIIIVHCPAHPIRMASTPGYGLMAEIGASTKVRGMESYAKSEHFMTGGARRRSSKTTSLIKSVLDNAQCSSTFAIFSLAVTFSKL